MEFIWIYILALFLIYCISYVHVCINISKAVMFQVFSHVLLIKSDEKLGLPEKIFPNY